jgi:hypothetical protein
MKESTIWFHFREHVVLFFSHGMVGDFGWWMLVDGQTKINFECLTFETLKYRATRKKRESVELLRALRHNRSTHHRG